AGRQGLSREAREGQQVFDEATELHAALPDDRDYAPAFAVQPVPVVLLEDACKAADGTQRRPQIVRNRVSQAFELAVELLQLGGQRLDARAQRLRAFFPLRLAGGSSPVPGNGIA